MAEHIGERATHHLFFVDGQRVGQGEVDNVPAGGSGFNNTVRQVIPLALTNGPVAVPAEATPLGVVYDFFAGERRGVGT